MIVALYDTNVLISGAFWRGIPRQLIRLARKEQIQVVTCQALLEELGMTTWELSYLLEEQGWPVSNLPSG
jgi:predicted nucleic acid-binding protein